MANKKTPTQRMKSYKASSRLCFAGEFLSVMTPFLIIGVAKYQDYFVEYNGTKMSLAATLAAVIMGLAIWLVAKKKFENSFITLIIGWFAVDGIFYLMGQIINDIAFIMLFGGIGILGAFGLDILSKKLDKKAEDIKKAIETANQENTVDEYKEELAERENRKKKKKFKVKIKKDGE